MTNPVTKARNILDALDGAESRTGEHFSKLKDDADDAYMKRVLAIADEQNVSLMKAHQIAQTDPVAVEAYDRSARIAEEHAVQVDAVRGIAASVED
jgi:hypothetical protein